MRSGSFDNMAVDEMVLDKVSQIHNPHAMWLVGVSLILAGTTDTRTRTWQLSSFKLHQIFPILMVQMLFSQI